jgi:hypothetical protein
MKNMYIYSGLQHINFDKLLSRIQSAERPKTVLSGIVSDIAKVALNAFILKRIIKHPFILHRVILGFAEEYGVALSGLRVGNNTLKNNKTSEDCIMDVKVSIESIDYSKLADIINESMKSTGTKTNNSTVTETIRIIKPFIGETMATVPPSAIVELFELLARDKVIELAQNSGITISDISLETR